jgi:hypothetical protein
VSALVVGALLLSAAVPSPALAGTYSWSLPTAQTPGPANPDHDTYGATPWSYDELQTVTTPGQQPSPTRLPSYSASLHGGLAGWYDGADADQPFVAANRAGRAVGVVPDGTLALQPARDRLVAVAWTSPLSAAQRVTVSGTFTALDADALCPSRPSWTLEQGSNVLSGGSAATGGSSQAISASPTVSPGQTLYLVIGWTGAMYDPACVTAGLTLSLKAPATPPTVTLDRPAAGDKISGAQPTFAGRASSDFGAAADVTVRVYKGSSSTGPVVEKLIAKRTGAAYSVPAAPPLANGTYTAMAEQDNGAGDTSFSSAATFTVDNVAPHVTLRAPGSGPLRTAQPVLSGQAGSRRGDAQLIQVGIYKGDLAQRQAFRYLVARRGADGQFSVRVTPSLPNGRYTAVAVQSAAGGVYGVSRPLTFRVAVPPPQPIGSLVGLDHAGRTGVRITCTASTGVCAGDVLVDTVGKFAPVPGGPRGPVMILFAHVSVPAGKSVVVQGRLAGYVAAALRRHLPLRVRVTASLTDSVGHQAGGSAVRMLRLTAPIKDKHR